MTETPDVKTFDPKCPYCAGTGLTLLMDECPCAESYVAAAPDRQFMDCLICGDIGRHTATEGCVLVESTSLADEEPEIVYGRVAVPLDGAHRTAPPAVTIAKPMSDAQVDFLRRLVLERTASDPTVQAAMLVLRDGGSAKDASRIIDRLLKIPATHKAPRPNSYPGECRTCGGPVGVGKGRIEKVDGRWQTFHLDGQCLNAAEAAELAADQVTEPGVYAHDGAYFRVRKGRYEKDTWWAEKIHANPHGVSFSRAGRASFLRASERLDWKAARDLGVAYNSCINCGKSLSDERSVVAGYGAHCAKTCGWPYPSAKLAAAVIADEATWDGSE